MKIIETSLKEVKILEPNIFKDDRGFFLETWNKREFAGVGLPDIFVQDNFSRSSRGVLRGLHYQIQCPQGKLIQVTRGEVYDVAVDMRESSQQLGQWVGVLLSESNKRQLWVPEGFAHGFYVLSEFADFHYKCTDYYAPQFERSLLWNDATVGVKWPIVEGMAPILAEKDAAARTFSQCDKF